MGALMRALDWSQTPVGPVETWPQSLRTVLSILLTSRHPIFVWWGKELVQFYNDGYRPMLGATKHPKALGQRAREGWGEIWDVIGSMIEAVMERGESTFIEDGLLCLNRNGYLEEAYFTYAYSPIRDESGGSGGVFCACQETTERILGERRLKMLRELSEATSDQQSVEASCHKAMRVLASNPNDIPFALLYLTDAEGRTAHLVEGAGVEPGALAAPRSLDAEDSQAPWPWASVRSKGEPVLLESFPSTFGPLPGGPWPEPATSALVLPLARPGHDTSAGMLVVGISPRKALDTEYRSFLELTATHLANAVGNARAFQEEKRRAEALAELNRAKTDFFSNVSHEFRTPLTLLLGPVEDGLADTEQPLPARQRERQETVQRNSLRLLKLVNQLLDFSRIEAGRMNAAFRPTELSALTAELASAFRSTIERAGMRLVVDCPPLPEPLYVDRELWEKIVLNLLSNAFKFTFEGEIRVSLEPHGEHVRLRVSDTGTGIPAHELPHLFERFHRVQGAKGRAYEGSGIGLALVKELVKLHGGTMEVQSTPGQGSTFTVSLRRGSAHLPPEHLREATPLVPSGMQTPFFLEEASQWVEAGAPSLASPAAASQPLAPAPRQPAQGKSPERILLADDNADMRGYIQRLLAQRWTVEAVASGTEALAAARAHPPHLILTDVMMPGMDGFGLLRELRADARTSSVPVVLLSARAGEEASIEGMQAGADDYLVKPFSARELVSRIAARLEIARAHAEARDARARLHSQVMQAPVAMSIVTGPDFTYEIANSRYLEMVGRQDVVGRPIRAVFPELPHDAPVFQMLEGIYANGRPVVEEELRVSLDRRGQGEPEDVYFHFTCQPVRNAAGAIACIMTVAVDITAQVEARTQLERLAAREREARALAQEADKRKDEFLAMLAHELRNPLAALSTALTMMGRHPGTDSKEARLRETCNRQVSSLVRMVDDLLDVSRITRGKVELRKKEVDFTTIVQNALATSRALLDARGHELSMTFAPGDFRLEADATRLEQVVSNLLTNAAKYTEPGGSISVRVGRETSEGTPWAVLRVRDTGRGIAPHMLGKVFDLFVQVEPSIDRSAGGLGIGLTLVERLVAMHGGSVSAQSEGLGKGSEFTVRLPLARKATLGAQVPAPLPLQEPAPVQKRRVVVVEDNEDVREMMKELLEDMGHEVALATDGLEGVTKVLELLPDVALVDVGLPGIDGYEVARRVRATQEGNPLCLVALTGYGGADAKAKAREAGFDLHLAKPIHVDDLTRVIESPPGKGTGRPSGTAV
jgi:signal transduction histidine kinase/DNA-binding response OmpR family regulator